MRKRTAARSPPVPQSPPSDSSRYERLDALRGAAVVWMAIFHFCFDLAALKITRENFYTDPFWTVQRTVIVTLFVLCAGVGQAVALQQGQGWGRFWRRWAQVAGCALLVTAGSMWMFPRSFISFGVLHAMAVMLVLLRLAAPLGQGLWLLGTLALLLPWLVQHPFFDTRWTNWIGLVTHKPVTEDYVPLLPWIGVMAWGLVIGRWLLAYRPDWIGGPLWRPLRGLAVLGRWSLSFYMLHQPVLIGSLMAWQALRG